MEAEAAERFLSILPRAEMVKFAKNGSDATTAAVRLARAVTGRDHVAICRDHPFFSVDDWFIGATAMPAGIPKITRSRTVSSPRRSRQCPANCSALPGQIACLVLEAADGGRAAAGYLEGLRALCDGQGSVLVFDEMITGFRWSEGALRTSTASSPDLSTFGKALGQRLRHLRARRPARADANAAGSP